MVKSHKRLKTKDNLIQNVGKLKKKLIKKKNKSKGKYYKTKKGGSKRTAAGELKEKIKKNLGNEVSNAPSRRKVQSNVHIHQPYSNTEKIQDNRGWLLYHHERKKSRLEQLQQETEILKQMDETGVYNFGRNHIAYDYKIDTHPKLKREKTEKQWTSWTRYLKDIPEQVMEYTRKPDNYNFSNVIFLDRQINRDPISDTLIVTIGIWNITKQKYDRFEHEIPKDTKLILWEGTSLKKLDNINSPKTKRRRY
jgi:hypothetical protein